MCGSGKCFWPSMMLALLLVADVVSCRSNDKNTPVKKTAKSSATVATSNSTSNRYVRLQLEDLEVPEAETVTAVQQDGDFVAEESAFVRLAAGHASFSSGLECLPLTADGGLSDVCGRSAAGFPNLFNHTDEKQSDAHLRSSAGRWRGVLRLSSSSHRPSASGRDMSSAGAEVCRVRLTAFVCSVYSPPCSHLPDMATDRFTSLVPCRSLCESARDRCCNTRLHTSTACDWPRDWNCQQLPANRMCDKSSALNDRLRFISDKHRTITGDAEAMLQPGPVATLPLPPRTPYDTPANLDISEKRRHRQTSDRRSSNRGTVISGSRKGRPYTARSSKTVH